MKKPKIKISLIDQKGHMGAIVVIELEIPLTLIPKEALSAQWPCTWLSLTLTFWGMGENSPANQMAPLYSAVQMWM